MLPIEQDKNHEDNTLRLTLFGTIETITFALSLKSWRLFFAINTLASVFLGTASLLFFPFFRMYFGFTESQCGHILSAAAVGTIVGGIGANKFFKFNTIHQKNAAISLGLSGMALVIMALVPHMIVLIITLVFTFQMGLVVFFRSIALALTESVDRKNLGRWWTANDAVSRIAGLVGILVGASIMDEIGAAKFYQFLGVSVVTLAGCLIYLKNLKIRKVQSCETMNEK